MIDENAPQILNRKIVASSRLFEIEEVHLRFSNGEERYFERIKPRSQGAVMVIPMLDNDTVLLVREYGTGIDGYNLGFPKGGIEPNEDLLVTANRELQEETGFAARELQELKKISLSPSYQTATMRLVLARDLYESPLVGDEPEPIVVVPWKLDDVDELLSHPEFFEARSIAAFLLICRERDRGHL